MRSMLKTFPIILASGMLFMPRDASAGIYLFNQYSLAFGIGSRPLANVEHGLEDYLAERGYTEQFSGLAESFKLRDSLTYVVCDFSFIQPKLHLWQRDTVQFLTEVNLSSSKFSSTIDTGKDYFPLNYDEVDLGDMGVDWEIDLPLYLAVAEGIVYTPVTYPIGWFHVAPQVVLTGGYGYFHANVDINMNYAPSELMQEVIDQFGQEWFDENVGIPSKQTISTTLDGHGFFAHPRIGFDVGYGNINLILRGGFRFEHSFVKVVESLNGKQIHAGDADLNINGWTSEVLLKYTF
ncbi:MAG TPA: hypothetical protein VJJ79_00430 [Candidatus Nanoarchaeia archaeon]|nr:hypothetical protein [Candidatus Nanoarchaeia archaeon]